MTRPRSASARPRLRPPGVARWPGSLFTQCLHKYDGFKVGRRYCCGRGSDGRERSVRGMPERDELRLHRGDGVVTVAWGARVLFRFDEADTGMRNLAMVALAEAGVAGTEVAALFGLSADYFSKLRVRARRRGSAELVRPMGRPPKLTGADVAKARRWAGEGVSGREIARLTVASHWNWCPHPSTTTPLLS